MQEPIELAKRGTRGLLSPCRATAIASSMPSDGGLVLTSAVSENRLPLKEKQFGAPSAHGTQEKSCGTSSRMGKPKDIMETPFILLLLPRNGMCRFGSTTIIAHPIVSPPRTRDRPGTSSTMTSVEVTTMFTLQTPRTATFGVSPKRLEETLTRLRSISRVWLSHQGDSGLKNTAPPLSTPKGPRELPNTLAVTLTTPSCPSMWEGAGKPLN